MSLVSQLFLDITILVIPAVIGFSVYGLIKKRIILKDFLTGVAHFFLIRMVLVNLLLTLISMIGESYNSAFTQSFAYLLITVTITAVGRVIGQAVLFSVFRTSDRPDSKAIISNAFGFSIAEILIDFLPLIVNDASIVSAINTGTIKEILLPELADYYISTYTSMPSLYFLFYGLASLLTFFLNYVIIKLIHSQKKKQQLALAVAVAFLFYFTILISISLNVYIAIFSLAAVMLALLNLSRIS